jgi:hypothetical protein
VERSLESILASMRDPDPAKDYYAITLTADEDGRVFADTNTQWAGPHPERHGWELREGRIVAPALFDLVHGRGNYLVIEGEAALAVWLTVGGPAFVEEATAREHLPELVNPHPSVATPGGGYRDPDELPPSALRRQPSPKLRGEVMKRDRWRCRLCGRSADDSVDIRLHVHHVRPWAVGGLTELQNLITLCQTCHEGLEPHFEAALIYKAADPITPGASRREERAEGIRRYRALVAREQDHRRSQR